MTVIFIFGDEKESVLNQFQINSESVPNQSQISPKSVPNQFWIIYGSYKNVMSTYETVSTSDTWVGLHIRLAPASIGEVEMRNDVNLICC